MCMICSGLKNNKLTIKQAKKKYEEFLDLDLIDEEHQEDIEMLLSDLESEEVYWDHSHKEYLRSRQDYKDEEDSISDFYEEQEDEEED